VGRISYGGQGRTAGRLILRRAGPAALMRSGESGRTSLRMGQPRRWECIELRTQRADSIPAFTE